MSRSVRNAHVDDVRCPRCSRGFERRDDRDRHVREHHGTGSKVTCPFCETRPFLKRCGRRHLKTDRCRQRREELGIQLTDPTTVQFRPVVSGNPMEERVVNVPAPQEQQADPVAQLFAAPGGDPFLYENLQEADAESEENDSLFNLDQENLDLENMDLADWDVVYFVEL